MSQPSQQAMNDRPYTVVDGTLITDNPGSQGDHKERAQRKLRKCPKCIETGMYEQNPSHKCAALGRGRECDYFDDDYRRRCWRCWKHGRRMTDPYIYLVTKGDKDDCNKFWPSYKGMCRPKNLQLLNHIIVAITVSISFCNDSRAGSTDFCLW